MNNFKYAVRQLLNAPGFSAVVILSLALGIGANTAVFTWIESLLLRPIAGAMRQEELAVITTSHGDKMWDTVSLPDLQDMAKLTTVFSGLTGSQQTPACLTVDDTAEWIYGQIVTASFFEVLRVKPLLGRTFTLEDDTKPGHFPVIVIGESLWRRRFNGAPDAIGRVVDLNRHAFTIVGVIPAAFHGDTAGLKCEFWAPSMMHHEVAYSGIAPDTVLQRYARWHHTYARLQPGVTLPQAQAALDTLARELEKQFPSTNRDVRFHLRALWNATYGAQAIFRPMLFLLLTVSLGVMVIVCANVANLLLARATSRDAEIAIRLAVGATRGRIVTQLFTESLLLALLGGLGGVLLAFWLVDLFALFVPTTSLPVALTQRIDGRVLGATTGLTVLAGMLFGLLPALQVSRPKLQQALKESGRTPGLGNTNRRARGALVIAEVSLAVLLLVGAGLCYRGLRQSRAIELGLVPDQVLLVGLRVGMNGHTTETAPALYRTLRERIGHLPGVEAVALANWFPLGFEDTGTSNIEVVGQPASAQPLNFRLAIVSPDYFRTLRIPLVAGRDFTDRDDRNAAAVIVINETMARRFWPAQDALGREIKINGRSARVIGVARTGKYRYLNDAPECFFYVPSAQAPWALDLGLCVRASHADFATLATQVRNEIRTADANVQVWQTLPFNDYVAAAGTPQRIAASLLGILSAVALLLAAMGVYAVMSYTVGQRRREIGIRMALGATPRHVLWHVSRSGLALTGAGLAIGLVASIGLTSLPAGFLYGVSRFDLATYAGVALALGTIASLACYLPARRATRVDPIQTLRAE